MKPTTISATLLLLATLAMVVAPAFTPSFSGYAPDQLPVRIERHPIQPAGYAFAIWGVIYLWLILHAGFGLWCRADDPAWRVTRTPLICSVALGAVWLGIASHWPLLATAVILLMGGLALRAYLLADPWRDRWLLAAPLAIYSGWLTAACAVSVGVVLGGYGVLAPSVAALGLLALVVGIAVWMAACRPSMPIYGLTIVWAASGIVLANWPDNRIVALAAAAGAVTVLAFTAIKLRRR